MGEPVMICATCGSMGKVKIEKRGSILVLVVLFLFMIIPGVIYLAWMLSGDITTCRTCGSREVVRPESPRGRELVARYGG